MDNLRLVLAVWNRFKLAIVSPIYLVALLVLGYRAVLLFAPFIVAAILAYACDKERDDKGMDNFRGDWLFFRYGTEIDVSYFGLPVKPTWSPDEVAKFASQLRERLAQRIRQQFPPESVGVLDLTIQDQETYESKEFLRIKVRSRFGSTLTQFIHYTVFGQSITAHHFTYLRGVSSDWEVIKFILVSPWTIWFWGVPWLLNRYSIIAAISQFRSSSFDGIDIRTMHSLTNQRLLGELEDLLAEAGLLTEEVKQTLHYHIKTTQNIRISDSSHVSLGDVRQASTLRTSGKVALG